MASNPRLFVASVPTLPSLLLLHRYRVLCGGRLAVVVRETTAVVAVLADGVVVVVAAAAAAAKLYGALLRLFLVVQAGPEPSSACSTWGERVQQGGEGVGGEKGQGCKDI